MAGDKRGVEILLILSIVKRFELRQVTGTKKLLPQRSSPDSSGIRIEALA